MTTRNDSARPRHSSAARVSAVSRRGFLTVSTGVLASAVALPLLNACAPVRPAAPTAARPIGTSAPIGSATRFPAYIPFAGGARPDFHIDDPLYSDAYENFPSTLFTAHQEAPGSGRTISALRAFTNATLDVEPKWRHSGPQLNTGYHPKFY